MLKKALAIRMGKVRLPTEDVGRSKAAGSGVCCPARLGPVQGEDISGKLECVSCGALLLDIPKDADNITVIMCAKCHRVLGTLAEIRDELVRVKGAFDFSPPRRISRR